VSLAVAPVNGGVVSTPRTILVVDRRETIRRVLALILESEGLQVVTTGTASAGLAVAFQVGPAAVLLDLSLADESALPVLRTLKSDPRTQPVPVILLDGGDRLLSESDCALAETILPKPLDLDALVARMSGLVAQPA
jgi:DNA-binding response OmpR family regulator